MSSNKRKDAPESSTTNKPRQRQKQSLEPELKSDLTTIKVENIDAHITNLEYADRVYMEARMFGTKVWDEYAEQQLQLFQVLGPHAHHWIVLRRQSQKACTLEKRMAVTKFLREQYHKCEELGIDDLKDAFGYRLAYWIYAGFLNLLDKTDLERSFKHIGVSIEETPGFLDLLGSSVLRHLEAAKGWTWWWAMKPSQDMPNPPLARQLSTMLSPHMSRRSSSQMSSMHLGSSQGTASQSNKQADGEDAFVTNQARQCFQDLGANHIVPWDQVKQTQPEVGRMLERAWLRVIEKSLPTKTPPAMLLVGAQGTGKSTIPMSWAKQRNGLMAIIDGSVKGSLQGQTERVLTKVLADARHAAEAGQVVVILFEEVDHFLGTRSGNDGSRGDASMEAIIGLFRTKMDPFATAGLPIFVFGATSQPERLDMSGETLAAVWEIVLKPYRHTLAAREFGELATVSQGYCFTDLSNLVDEIVIDAIFQRNSACNWVKVKADGDERLWQPAVSGDTDNIKVASIEKMNEDGEVALLRAIDVSVIRQRLLGNPGEDGGSRPWSKINDPAVEEGYRRWLQEADSTA